ncbi:MAG: hypothetical protein FJX77_07655, partial [Armatimonadetes bacterium]|nr:hypothetical protein [Armatimonadota bacterium]
MIHRQHRFLTACIVPLLVVGGGADAAPRRRAVAPPSRKPAVRQVPARTRAVRGPELVRLVVQPEQFQLSSRRSRQLLVVTGTYSDGSVRDLSAAAEYRAEARRVARVSPTGLVEPAGDGTTTITVRSGLRSARAQVRVTSMLDLVPKISFTREIVPVLTQAGCNSLSCHGSPVGKAGFKLSMYGFDPAQDYLAIVRQERTVPEKGLRVDSADREKSLVLTKPSMQLPHQGGMRFKK